MYETLMFSLYFFPVLYSSNVHVFYALTEHNAGKYWEIVLAFFRSKCLVDEKIADSDSLQFYADISNSYSALYFTLYCKYTNGFRLAIPNLIMR